jgi:hypothetical protein
MLNEVIVSEHYICLHCGEELIGDKEWLAHLKSANHAIATATIDPKPIEWPQSVRTEHLGD